MPEFAEFAAQVRELQPRSAIVLGSGLSAAMRDVAPLAVLPYAQIPNFTTTTVQGHRGQLVLGRWADLPVLVCSGRVHYYEGHPWGTVTRLVELLAELGIEKLTLTNAAGGLHPSLQPGDLMAITGHVSLLDAWSYQRLDVTSAPYTRLASGLHRGVYASLTGPCYETPAEIRALASLSIDAVGMSTAREAEAAHRLGLSVAGVSCITNKAAGLSDNRLSHSDVEATAKQAVTRLAAVLQALL